MANNKPVPKFFWFYFLLGFFSAVLTIHWIGAKNSIRVKDISIGLMTIFGVLLILLRAYKIIDIHDPEYQANPPWWIKFMMAIAAGVLGHGLGFASLTFVAQMLN